MNCSDKKIETRDALIQVAEKLFAEKGYDAVSTRELAEAAGVNLAAIQYHFGSKAKLFVAMVHGIMEKRGPGSIISALDRHPASRADAAARLVAFIDSHLNYLLDPEGPQCCKMMCREILGAKAAESEVGEALLSSVVDNYIRPSHEILVSLISKIDPSAPRAKLDHFVQSIIAQASFYVTHGPFVERLHSIKLTDAQEMKSISRDISEFSLRALGLSEKELQRALVEGICEA